MRINVPECFKTQAVDTCPFVLDFIPDWYKTQKICDKLLPQILLCYNFIFIDRIQEMRVKAVHNFLPKLKCVPHWFVTRKIIKKTL